MFKGLSVDGLLFGGQSSSPPSGQGGASLALDSQENSWIGLLFGVSRPAWSFLQKYLSGRTPTAALSSPETNWTSAELQTSFAAEEREFLRQLDDMVPPHAAPHLTYLRCHHHTAAGLREPEGGGAAPCLTAESLRELGIQSTEDMDFTLCQQTQSGYVSSARTLLSHVGFRLVPSQEIKHSAGRDWLSEASGGKSRMWWDSFWGRQESSQRGAMSDLSWTKDETQTDQLCPPAETKAAAVFVQGGSGQWTLGENTGLSHHKEKPANNGGLYTVQNTEWSMVDQRLPISEHLNCSGAAPACREVGLLTPDQDNGYSSLEEEHIQVCRLLMAKALSEEIATVRTDMDKDTPEGAQSSSGQVDKEEEMQEDEEGQEAAVLPSPQCQNKAIAFIMGCPCSDDDSSQSESDDDDEDDDGFDSKGSSDLSDSTNDEDDEDSDSEVDSEAERLWSSMCHSADPYNPQNFTAHLHTSTTPPRNIPPSTQPSFTQSTPASSPDLPPLPLTPSSPASDVWDDSASASEADEVESLRLWNYFSCSSDPYSPFNFQAPISTRGPVKTGPQARTRADKASQTPPRILCQTATSPPTYRTEEAEERLDSGFSEPSTSSSTQSCRTNKKVRFCDDVEEFFASCGEEEEDRRGPWEELARDRCRFLRRCQEVEQTIAFCLQPEHRRLAYQRLAVLHFQDI